MAKNSTRADIHSRAFVTNQTHLAILDCVKYLCFSYFLLTFREQYGRIKTKKFPKTR